MAAEMQSIIHDWVNQHAKEIIQLTEALMRFPSVNRAPYGDEYEAQQFVIQTMREMRLDTDVFLPTDVPELAAHPAYWHGREYANRPDVVGTWRGSGSGKSLLFSSHVDVVAGSPGGRFENFVPARDGDKLYGRGSNDMKGGLAATLMAVKCLQDLGVRLNGSVIVESVVDEENGGANGTLAARLRGHIADACIVPEPTGMVVAPAHKGGRIWDIRLKGSPGIGFGTDNIISPIYGMARLVTALEDWETIRNRVTPPHPQFAAIPGLPVLITKILAGEFEPGAGDAVPENAMMEIWVEEYPGTTKAEHYQRLIGYLEQVARDHPAVAKCKMTVEPVTRFLPGSEIPAEHPIVQTVSRAFHQALGKAPVVRGAPFACDVFVFNQIAHVPCVILGPRGGNAHSYDEWVIMQDLVDLTEIFARAAVEWCGVQE